MATRIRTLDEIEDGYSTSYLVSLVTFAVLPPIFAVAYLVSLYLCWNSFDRFREVGIRHALGVLFAVSIISFFLWVMFLYDIGSGHGKNAFAFIFFPPTFVVFALYMSMVAAGIIVFPVTFLAKLVRTRRSRVDG